MSVCLEAAGANICARTFINFLLSDGYSSVLKLYCHIKNWRRIDVAIQATLCKVKYNLTKISDCFDDMHSYDERKT